MLSRFDVIDTKRTVFTNAQIFDGSTMHDTRADVVIEADRIVDVGIGLDGDVEVDCTDHALLPGLIDCHVHLLSSDMDFLAELERPFSLPYYVAQANMSMTLDLGITTVRDAGGADLGVKRAQADGLIRGPRVHIAVSMISQTGGHGDAWYPCGCSVPSTFMPHQGRPCGVADGVAEVRKRVREMVRAGADVIKIATSGGVLSPGNDPQRPHFSPAELAVIVEEATAAGLGVMAHSHGADGIVNALEAGVRSIEHGTLIDDRGIERLLQTDAWLVPTLMTATDVIEAVQNNDNIPASMVDKALSVATAHAEGTRRAVEAGVKIAMGTDSGCGPHGRNLRELPLLRDAGMSPTAVLHASTRSAAELLGYDDLGRIDTGARADLALFRGDPTDLDNLGERVAGVWQDGVCVSSPAPLTR